MTPSPVGEDANSIRLLQNALKKSLEENGSNHPQTVSACENLGAAFQEISDYEQAANEFRRALKARELRKQHDRVQSNLIQLSCCLSTLLESDTVSSAVARRVSDHYVYTRPVGIVVPKYKSFQEIAPIGFRVKVLRVWFNNSGIRGIQMDYSDGSRSPLKGRYAGQVATHIFEAGETISEITTWVSASLESIWIELFEMETVRYEESGNPVDAQILLGRTEHGNVSYRRAETGTGILVGIHGKADTHIHQLGFIFLSPTHPLAQRSVLDIRNLEERSKRYYDCDISCLPDVFVTEGPGGSGGRPFQDVAEAASPVRRLSVWTSPIVNVTSDVIRGLQVTFDDGTTSVVRGEAEGQCTMFEFHPSEFITELVIAYGKANGRQYAWSFWFETSESRSCRLPNCESIKFNYKQDLKPGGILVGVYGYCEDDIDRLSFMFR